MDTKKLEALLTAVELGSFTRAAEVLGYTQSGLTHSLSGSICVSIFSSTCTISSTEGTRGE